MQELILEEKTTLSPVMKEIYRRLRTNLEFTGIENKVICLTSCMENDGKSSVSFNLAKILAENDKRVLFIDADMRNFWIQFLTLFIAVLFSCRKSNISLLIPIFMFVIILISDMWLLKKITVVLKRLINR